MTDREEFHEWWLTHPKSNGLPLDYQLFAWEAVQHALATERARTGWQTQSPAPKDGSLFLVRHKLNATAIVLWSSRYGRYVKNSGQHIEIDECSWMPIPEGPK